MARFHILQAGRIVGYCRISERAHVYDSDGKRYIDGIGGLWCVNVGYGDEEIADAMAEQARRVPMYSPFGHITPPSLAELSAKPRERLFLRADDSR